MPLAGKGMLLTSMDIDPADEADFNRWYDREHLEERVAIEGFIEARRYVAHIGSPKYLCLYSTQAIEVLDSPAYRDKLAHPTAWSAKTMARFKNMIRAVARITISNGTGRGAVLGIVRLRPQEGRTDELRASLQSRLDPKDLDGIISMHLLESDGRLSGPMAELAAAAGAADWFVLIDGTSVSAIASLQAARFTGNAAPMPATQISSGIYDLMWDLAKSDIAST
ncbi:hypothetical protein [Bradyrhizobium sp. STM 3562]|uniref:hypothetical protein n=1 Tax=Bradyrhizobium sp. STM 3562 TaxID=578924 RepID=UPI00388FEE68